MKNLLLPLVSLALLAASGCSPVAIVDKVAPADVQQASRQAYSDLKARRFDLVRARLRDELKGRDLDGEFRRMANAIPDEPEPEISAVDFNTTSSNGVTSYDITYRYQYSKQWVQARFAWLRENGDLRMTGFAVNALDNSAKDPDDFTFEGKGPVHYLVLLVAALVFAANVYALVRCALARGLRHKWAWILFIVFGIGAFRFNWTTGEWRVAFLNLQLMSVAALRLYGGAWTITVAVPVGALACLDKLRRLRAKDRAEAGRAAPPAA